MPVPGTGNRVCAAARTKENAILGAVEHACICILCGFLFLAASNAHAAIANYTLDNVILDDNTQMTGAFSWTYTSDFETGVGEWTSLDIPWTSHDQDDLNTTFELFSSIEITLDGNVHDDGVDITLFLLQPLSPTTSASIDLARSKYEIGGNGFHDGAFLSGTISPVVSAVPLPAALPLFLSAVAGFGFVMRGRRSRDLTATA